MQNNLATFCYPLSLVKNHLPFIFLKIKNENNAVAFQLTLTCSNSTIETLEKGVKYVQSLQ